MRDLSTGFMTQIDARALRPLVLTKAEFDSGDVRMFTGTGAMSYDGEEYLGGGNFLKMTTVEETQELKAVSVTYELSGVPSSYIALALSERLTGRPIASWFGVLDEDNVLETQQIYGGLMDTMPIEDDIAAGEATILLNTESDLSILRNAVDRNYTPEDQKIAHAGDLFLDSVPTIQDIQINWGPS